VIRRGFWLAAGAVTGIYGYRRVSAVGRRLSASLNPAEPAAALPQGARSAQSIRSAQIVRSAQSVRSGQSVRSAQSARLARRGRRGAIGLARGTYRFTRDVREGMDLYLARHSAPAGSTLGARDALETTSARPRSLSGSGKTSHLGSAETSHLDSAKTNHDPRPKDGH
jgi:hypothetical protein